MSETDELQTTCPLCGGDNACAVAAGRPHESCWCWSATLDPGALAAIPADARMQRCICAACGRVTEEHP